MTIEPGDAGLRVRIEQWSPKIAPSQPEAVDVAETLGIDTRDPRADWPIRTISTSRTKTLVPLRDRAVLDRIRTPGEEAWQLCEHYGSTGLYPFAPLGAAHGAVYAARQFPVRAGYPEDPATGVAAVALAVYLAQQGVLQAEEDGWASVEIWQGDAMGSPSVLWSAVRRQSDDDLAVRIGGTAEVLRQRTERIPPASA